MTILRWALVLESAQNSFAISIFMIRSITCALNRECAKRLERAIAVVADRCHSMGRPLVSPRLWPSRPPLILQVLFHRALISTNFPLGGSLPNCLTFNPVRIPKNEVAWLSKRFSASFFVFCFFFWQNFPEFWTFILNFSPKYCLGTLQSTPSYQGHYLWYPTLYLWCWYMKVCIWTVDWNKVWGVWSSQFFDATYVGRPKRYSPV